MFPLAHMQEKKFGFGYLFNGISIPYELLDAEILFICNWSIIFIFFMFYYNLFLFF